MTGFEPGPFGVLATALSALPQSLPCDVVQSNFYFLNFRYLILKSNSTCQFCWEIIFAILSISFSSSSLPFFCKKIKNRQDYNYNLWPFSCFQVCQILTKLFVSHTKFRLDRIHSFEQGNSLYTNSGYYDRSNLPR